MHRQVPETTFITPEQDWFSEEIIKALELSESVVQQELRTC